MKLMLQVEKTRQSYRCQFQTTWQKGKILNGISMEFMECLNEDEQKEEKTFSVHLGQGLLITTSTNLLDTNYEFKGFDDDLKDTIN